MKEVKLPSVLQGDDNNDSKWLVFKNCTRNDKK